MKKILDVFRTYCDAYLTYRNEFLTAEAFTSFYDIDEDEFNILRVAALSVREREGTYREINWEMNCLANEDYTEKGKCW